MIASLYDLFCIFHIAGIAVKDNRQVKFFRQLHHPHRLSVALRVGASEVAKKVYTIDTFKSHDNGVDQMDKFTTLSIFAENVKGYDNIVAIAGKSEEIIPALRLEVGVVFIDGWHEYEQVKKDIEVCGPKLKEGGIMIFHDFASYHNHVGRAVKELGVQYWNPIPQLAVVVKKGEANAFN